jgi:ATP-binding cassette subfamily C (CFTR/MRP) protein 1
VQNGQTLERLRAPRSRLKWLGDKGGRIAHCEEEEEEEEEEEGGAKSAAAARAPPALAEAQQPSTGNGHLILTDVHLRYAPDLPLVLRGVSLSVPPGKKVAVVGRTGAGKSSLIAAICRLVEVQGGVVALDGRDLRTLHLAEVRAACVVVTQDSLFFQGSLRFNLDPFATYSDAEIQAALNAVGFFKPDAAAAGGQVEGGVAAGAVAAAALESEVGERGAGLSAGQCQLVQLARALLRRPNLLLLDEATASLDEGAEELVLGALRGLRLSCVIIAHRLACAVECDLVCVMGEGRVIECGEPWELLQKEGGAFAALAAAAPNRALIEARAREGRPGGGGMQPVN